MRPNPRVVIGIPILLAAILAGCGRQLSSLPLLNQKNERAIPFAEIYEERFRDNFKLEKTERLDVDGDGDDEWLVFYRFDPYETGNWANTPVHGIVYDAVPCEVPVIEEYRLPTPDNDYLSEGRIRVTLDDILAEPGKSGGIDELVVFGDGNVKTLSFYRFFDRRTNPCRRIEEGERGFQLLGLFRANASIERDGKVVVTKDRTVLERSQLAIQKKYLPREDLTIGETYLQPNGQLVFPAEQTVAFTFGLPEDPRDSPYPEKSVATFYLALGVNNEKAKSFLTDELQPAFENTTGLPIPVSQISHVLIYSLSYTPDPEAERAREDRFVEVVVAAVNKQGIRQAPRRVRWRLAAVPIPDRQDCEWRLAELVSVTAAVPEEPPAVAVFPVSAVP